MNMQNCIAFILQWKGMPIQWRARKEWCECKLTVQTEREEFKCELCIFKTDKNDRFERHKKDIHSVQGKYFCTKCERFFYFRKDFNGY